MKNLVRFALAAFFAVSSQGFALVSPLPTVIQVQESTSENIIKHFKEQNVTAVVPTFGSLIWSFESADCQFTYFEVSTPNGGPVLEYNHCVLTDSKGHKVNLSPEISAELIEFLDSINIPYTGISGFPIRNYKLDNFKCQSTQMELIAPGGGGFQVREFFACQFDQR